MKMKLEKKIILLLLIFLPLNAFFLESKKIEFNFDIGMPLGKTIETNYLWNWDTSFIDVTEEALILNKSIDLIVNFSTGLRYMLKENFGFFFTLSSLNYPVNSISDYSLDFAWYDGEYDSVQKKWLERNGKIAITPFTIGLIIKKHISAMSSIIIKGGMSIALANTNINGTAGFAEAFETDTEYRINWYALDVEIDRSETLFGGNLGLEYEIRIARSFDFYAGVEYFYFPSKTYKWEVLTKEFYDKIGEYTILIDPEILHDVEGDITAEIKFSNMRIYTGFRYYF